MEAAGTLIRSLEDAGTFASTPQGPMCDAIVADCLTYHILGSTISPVDTTMATVYDQIDVTSILRRAEAFSYHCSPPDLLNIVLSTSRLSRTIASDGLSKAHIARATSLMNEAMSFDIGAWVHSIANLSPQDDLKGRVRVASAHQAAVRLYILLRCARSRRPVRLRQR